MLARHLTVVFVLLALTALRADQGSPAKPGALSPLCQLNGGAWRFAERLVDRLLAEAIDPSDAIAIAKRGLSGPEVASLRDLAALRRVRDHLLGPAGVDSVVRGELHERLRRIQQEVRAHRAAADDHGRRRPR